MNRLIKLIVLILLLDVIVLGINENIILFFSYVLLLNILIVIILDIKERYIKNIKVRDLKYQEMLYKYTEVRYKLILLFRYNIIEILKMFEYIYKIEQEILKEKINVILRKKELIYKKEKENKRKKCIKSLFKNEKEEVELNSGVDMKLLLLTEKYCSGLYKNERVFY